MCFACKEGCGSCTENGCSWCQDGWAWADITQKECTKASALGLWFENRECQSVNSYTVMNSPKHSCAPAFCKPVLQATLWASPLLLGSKRLPAH